MTTRLFYVDESYDEKKFCLSAIAIRHLEWRECFDLVKEHRKVLNEDYGVFLRKEMHSRDFVAGRGRISKWTLGKHIRSRIFEGWLRLVAQLPEVVVFNVCLDVPGRRDVHLDAWDRLLNRIERTMLEFENREIPLRKGLIAALPDTVPSANRGQLEVRLNAYRPRALIFADEGKERQITKTLRKMNVFNPIPSKFGSWGTGKTKNIAVQRVIEDPIFKKSRQSYFIQLADAVAFALLKRETTPTPNVKKYGINKMFEDALSGVCFRPASPDEPSGLGIVRK